MTQGLQKYLVEIFRGVQEDIYNPFVAFIQETTNTEQPISAAELSDRMAKLHIMLRSVQKAGERSVRTTTNRFLSSSTTVLKLPNKTAEEEANYRTAAKKVWDNLLTESELLQYLGLMPQFLSIFKCAFGAGQTDNWKGYPIKEGALHLVMPQQYLNWWHAIPDLAGLTWIDWGVGDAKTFTRLSEKWTNTRFAGFNSILFPINQLDTTDLQDNQSINPWARRVSQHIVSRESFREEGFSSIPVIMKRPSSDLHFLSTESIVAYVNQALPKGADIVSFFYPWTNIEDINAPADPNIMERRGIATDPFVYLLHAALKVLRPGGIGVVVTENPDLIRRGVEMLRSHPLAGRIVVSPRPFSQTALTEMGIQPYAPTMNGMLQSATNEYGSEKYGAFNWGFTLAFERSGDRNQVPSLTGDTLGNYNLLNPLVNPAQLFPVVPVAGLIR